jgi:hypothetical protein
MKNENRSMIRSRIYSLRSLLFLILIAAIVSAWTAARLRKTQTEQRIAARFVGLGASIYLTDGDRGWITGLHFSQPARVTDEHLRELAKLEGLKTLYLNQTQVTGDGLAALARFPALRELHVKESQLTTDGIRHLQQLQQLEKIVFWGSSSDDPRAKQILQSLPNIKSD